MICHKPLLKGSFEDLKFSDDNTGAKRSNSTVGSKYTAVIISYTALLPIEIPANRTFILV
jgi:hypothetical protein